MKTNHQKAVVVSPINLKRGQVSQIKKVLEEIMGTKDFLLEIIPKPSLLGGIIIQIGSREIDLSLNGKLKQIGNSLNK